MTALPSGASCAIFPAEEYRLGLRWWLGAPLITETGARCPGCGQSVDPHGDHFLCCPRNNFAPRHDAVQDAIFNITSSTGQSVQREVALPNAADSHVRPADLLLGNWHAGRPGAVDVTISHGWPPGATTTSVPRDNWRPFLKRREAEKHQKYDVLCADAGWQFSAAAFGTWGGWGPEAAKTLSRMLKRAATWEDPDGRGAQLSRLHETIGVALFPQMWHLLGAKNHIC